MGSFWNTLGLEDNPYDPRPLTINDKDRKLFVGRTNELTQLSTLVSGDKGGIIIIEGEVGVGKTSFVNIFQHDKWKHEKLLPSSEKIELGDNTNSVNFMLSVLSNMIFNLEKIDSGTLLKKDQVHKNTKALIAKTIESGWVGSISVAGFGGGVSRHKTVSQPAAVVLPTILDAMDKWVSFVINKLGYSSIIVPVDNFDIVDEDVIIDFLNGTRDILIGRSNIWWLLIGQKGLFSLIEKKAHRVSEIITGKPVVLNSLSLKEMHQMINLRYENLKKTKPVEQIIPSQVIDILYDASKGEARYILKRITDMAYSFIGEFPSERKISLNIAKNLLHSDVKKRIENAELTERQSEVLQRMVKIGSFQPKEFTQFGLKSAQALKDYVDKFNNFGFVKKEETSGKAVYYRTTGDVNIYFKRQM